MTSVQAIASTSTNVAVTWAPDSNSRQTGFKVSYRVRKTYFEIPAIKTSVTHDQRFPIIIVDNKKNSSHTF